MSLESRAELAMSEWTKTQEGSQFTGEVKAAPVAKRAFTMSQEHGDMAESMLGELELGFEGDFSEGEGELVAVVQANQETAMLRKRKRGTSGKRLSGAQRRKLKRNNH